jgi:hypothetical protein
MFVVKGLKMVSMNRTSTLVSGSIHSSKISDLRDLFEMYEQNKVKQKTQELAVHKENKIK